MLGFTHLMHEKVSGFSLHVLHLDTTCMWPRLQFNVLCIHFFLYVWFLYTFVTR